MKFDRLFDSLNEAREITEKYIIQKWILQGALQKSLSNF